MKRITNDAKIIDLYYLFSPKRDTRRSSSPLLIDTVQQSELSILNNPLTVPPFEDNRVYVSTRCTNLAAERVSARAQIRLIDSDQYVFASFYQGKTKLNNRWT